MPTSCTALLVSTFALAAACASGNPPPEGGTSAQPGRTRTSAFDSLRANRVIENARPDAPARAGLLIVANQQGASATIVNAADMKTVADLKAKGEERCTAEDDRRADGFLNDALAIVTKK